MAKEIPISEFKENCLKLIDELSKDNRDFIITKRGKALAKIVSINHNNNYDGFFGLLKGKAIIKGDIVDSLNEEWNASAE